MICSDSSIEVTLLQAWRFWLDGCSTGKLILWGYPIFWLGRVGKVIELASALMIVAELIGQDRLNALGRLLKVQFGLKLFKFLFSNIGLTIKTFLSYQKGTDDVAGQAKLFLEKVRIPLLVAAFLCMLLTNGNIVITLLLVCLFLMAHIIFTLLEAGEYVKAVRLEGMIISLPIYIPFLILFLIYDTLLVIPISWIIEGRSRDKLIKIVSVLLLLLGFHFDLLSS